MAETAQTNIIIGLGNPDPLLKNTYHNVGILALKYLVKKIEGAGEMVHFKNHDNLFEYAKMEHLIFIRSLVFMNESGLMAKEVLRTFKANPDQLMVLHDDSDITIGEIKFSKERNAAGHHGIESIIRHIHSNEFLRARIGIRDKNEKQRKKAGEFVLKEIKPKDKKNFETVFEKIEEKIFALKDTSHSSG